MAWSVNDDTLREAFSKYGELEECTVLKDRQSGKSRGRGIVRFATEEAMKKAIEEMNGSELEGRAIAVRQFLPKSQLAEKPKEAPAAEPSEIESRLESLERDNRALRSQLSDVRTDMSEVKESLREILSALRLE